MNVLICNERFLFRFGLDRVLIVVGQALKQLGHNVYYMGNNFDSEIIGTFADKVIQIPECTDYYHIEEFTLQWVQENLSDLFSEEEFPDIALLGGWPFFSSISYFEQIGIRTVFNDCGAVPLDGFEGGALVIQEKLRKLRRDHLSSCSGIIAISQFIANSQSALDSSNVDVETIYLGSDHMNLNIWMNKDSRRSAKSDGLELVKRYRQNGYRTILSLGRWETNCYKNSDAAYAVIPALIEDNEKTVLFVLAPPSGFTVPDELREHIVPLGYPNDEELTEIMVNVDLGLSFSLWEGFNLPLAEMQLLQKPVIVFEVAAHPEVAVHSWFLVKNEEEMIDKAKRILSNVDVLDADSYNEANERFRSTFTWKNAINRYTQYFEKLLIKQLRIIIDVTNATKDPANSGVIRVTRRLSRNIQESVEPVFVVWNDESNQYYMPSETDYHQLSQFNGPLIRKGNFYSRPLEEYLSSKPNQPTWILFAETISEQRAGTIRAYARKKGFQTVAIFYDAIPILYPQYCNDAVVDNHYKYMIGLAECDLVIPISQYSETCLIDFWNERGIQPTRTFANLLPGEFGGVERGTSANKKNQRDVKILCVSTLEPRKNHKSLIEACLLLSENHPELDWTLTLVGNRYAGNDEIPAYVQSISRNYPKIQWLGIVDDQTLNQLYQDATFTVYPSIVEGYGMPIMESVWYGKPCICSNTGVMAELASEGGCLPVDILNKQELSHAIYRLSTNDEFYNQKVQEATQREIKTWSEYTLHFLAEMSMHTDTTRGKSVEKTGISGSDWKKILYPNCLCENWQMNHSERLGLTALLARINPTCSIEIGTYQGGSLSLISQYSKMVFSIDIDPSIPDKYKSFANVSFFTGPSRSILPLLFDELDAAGIAVDFMLIDGDHSAEGIKADIRSLVSYVPKKPMFVVLHDGFNPECRRGMLEGGWSNSPYVQWVDLDFVPGRLIEHGGGGHGEMWGGLGCAYLSPEKRVGDLKVNASAQMMFDKIKAVQQL